MSLQFPWSGIPLLLYIGRLTMSFISHVIFYNNTFSFKISVKSASDPPPKKKKKKERKKV